MNSSVIKAWITEAKVPAAARRRTKTWNRSAERQEAFKISQAESGRKIKELRATRARLEAGIKNCLFACR